MKTDPESLLSVLLRDYEEDLTGNQLRAFRDMEGKHLTGKQEAWILGVAEKFGLVVAPAQNLFSSMSKEKQADQRKLSKTKLPWERGEDIRPLKPPGRQR